MSTTPTDNDSSDAIAAVAPAPAAGVMPDPIGLTVRPDDQGIDPAAPVAGMAGDGAVEWFEDGGRKTALGVWAGTAVLAYAAMQVSGYFADWPFVALVAGAVTYFAVRGVALVRREMKRNRGSYQG